MGYRTRDESDGVYGGPPAPPSRSGHHGDPGRRASDGMLAHQLQPLVVEPTPPRRSLPAGRFVSGQTSLTGSQAEGFLALQIYTVHVTMHASVHVYMHACVHVHVHVHCIHMYMYILNTCRCATRMSTLVHCIASVCMYMYILFILQLIYF